MDELNTDSWKLFTAADAMEVLGQLCRYALQGNREITARAIHIRREAAGLTVALFDIYSHTTTLVVLGPASAIYFKPIVAGIVVPIDCQ